MGPVSTGLGQILFYFVEDETGKRTPQQIREIQDWLIKFNLQTVKGVTEVLSLGGDVKQYQIRVRPIDLLRYDLSLSDVVEAVKANNSNVGAQFIVKNAEEYIVRSVGLAEKIPDLENIVLKSKSGTPVFLRQVADVATGGEVRRGLATMNGKGEAVVGMVLKLIGTNTSTVIKDVKDRMDKINKVLPPGIKVVPYYDQATLVAKCVRTVTNALIEAVLLIVLIQLLMLGGIRPSIVVLAAIPFSLAFSFLAMKYLDISANLMSLGGLAIALGLLVDGAVVMVENVDRTLREEDPEEPLAPSDPQGVRGSGAPHRPLAAHHRDRLPAPVHPAGSGREDLPSAGADDGAGDVRLPAVRRLPGAGPGEPSHAPAAARIRGAQGVRRRPVDAVGVPAAGDLFRPQGRPPPSEWPWASL